MRPATSAPRLGFFSAMPIHSTAGWRAATSPRNSPTRPAPTMASPMPLAFLLIARLPSGCGANAHSKAPPPSQSMTPSPARPDPRVHPPSNYGSTPSMIPTAAARLFRHRDLHLLGDPGPGGDLLL